MVEPFCSLIVVVTVVLNEPMWVLNIVTANKVNIFRKCWPQNWQPFKCTAGKKVLMRRKNSSCYVLSKDKKHDYQALYTI